MKKKRKYTMVTPFQAMFKISKKLLFFGAFLLIYTNTLAQDCNVAPILSQNADTLCDVLTVNLDSYVTNAPSGDGELVWSTSQVAGSGVLPSSIVSASGTYYAWYTGLSFGLDCSNPSFLATAATTLEITIGITPTVTGTTSSERCGPGTVTLGATATAGTLNWYAAATGGVSLGTGTSFTTPSIGTTTTYYVDATDDGCTTPTRTAVVATVKTVPTVTGTTPGSSCGPGTVTLGATASAGTLNWYAAPTGGLSLGTGPSFTTPSIATTTTYYVDATDDGCTTASRTAVVATINTAPTVTGTAPGSSCGPGTVTLGATASAGTLNWYAAPTGGLSLGTGPSFTTPSIATTTTYYVDATDDGCTTASRTAVVATINTAPTVTGTTPGSSCGPGTVTLGATSSAGALNWYAAPTGGLSLGTGPSFTTPSIATTTTYYVDATADGCTTASRTAVVATINTAPTVTGTTPGSSCGPGTVTLGATASAGTLNWYAAPTGGLSLGTGPSFTTPSIATTTTYYVDATDDGCTTASRTAVVATINTAPTVTGTTPGSSCGPGTVTLGATASAGTLNWYAAPTGGLSLGTGPSFTTPSIATTTTYYVDATDDGCTTASRTAVIATVIDEPFPGTANNTSVCNTNESGQPTSLDLDDQLVGADNGNWSLTSFPVGANITIGGNNSVNFSGQPLGNYEFTFTTTDAIAPCSNQSEILTINVVDCSLPCNAGNNAPVLNTNIPRVFCDEIDVSLNDYINSSVPSGAVLIWSTLSDPTNTNAYITDTEVANPPNDGSFYAVYYDATNDCYSPILEVELTLNPIPVIAETLGDERCGPGEVTLSANAAADADTPPTFTWYDSATGGSLLGTGPTFTGNISTTTSYFVEATANGCVSERQEVIATIYPAPSAGTTTNTSACSIAANGTSIRDLDDLITGQSSGSWSVTTDPSNSIVLGSDNIVDFEGLTEGSYVFTYTTDDATPPFCDNVSSQVTITVNDCDMDTDLDGLFDGIEAILGTDPNNVDSDGDGIEDGVEVGDDSANPLDEDGDGIIDALDSNIDDTDMDGVVDQLDPANTNPCLPNPDSEFCVATVDLEITKTADVDYLRINEQMTFTITVNNISVENAASIQVSEILDATGFNYISHFTGAGSGVYDEVAGTWDIPLLNAGDSVSLVILVEAIASGFYDNTATIVEVSPFDIDPDNNEATVTIEVGERSNNECGFLFNQFSPNGDGTNDFLYINCITNPEYAGNSLEIYDRYGNQVFATRDYDNTWDGTRNNKELPKGTYFYILDLADGSEVKKGWIQIIR